MKLRTVVSYHQYASHGFTHVFIQYAYCFIYVKLSQSVDVQRLHFILF